MKPFFVLAALTMSSSALAEVKVWENPGCAGGDCEIRSMKITISPGANSNVVVAEMLATKPEHLAKYAFVQYIRGCVFESTAQGPTRLGRRTHLGQDSQPFLHASWEVDTTTKDPIYWSTRNPGWDELRGFEILRTANYLVKDPQQTSAEHRWGGKVSNVLDNRLFVKDAPTGGSLSSINGKKTATNSTLEFRICLMEVAKLPTQVEKATVEYPNPVACLEWNSRFVYNFRTARFAAASQIHPYCRPQ